jgi:hypothetical protein
MSINKTAQQNSTLYLVVRNSYGVNDHAGIAYYTIMNEELNELSTVPVRAFTDKTSAEDCARQLDEEVRATLPLPLLIAESDDENEAFASLLLKRIQELQLPQIVFSKKRYERGADFRNWWIQHATNLTAAQKAALWEPFQETRFHTVREMKLED